MSEEVKVLSEVEQIERHQALAKRYKALSDQHIRLQAEQAGLKRDYEREVTETEAEFETSDIGKLREMYKTERQEGSDNILAGEKECEEIEAIYAAIEAKREQHVMKA